MKNRFQFYIYLSILFSIGFAQISIAQEVNDWENPLVINKNKEKGHSTYIPFNSTQNALDKKFFESENYQSLNGVWKFKLVDNVSFIPEGF